jgi:hypothetical protein
MSRGMTRLGVALGLAAVLVIAVGTAHAGPAVKNYRVAIDPVATTATYTLKLTNDGSSTHNLGSANVYVPAGFTVGSVAAAQAPTGRSWSASLSSDGSVIELRAATLSDTLAPGEHVSSSLTLQVPCTSGEWRSLAKQSNDFNGFPGNDFKLAGDAPVVTAAPGAATTLAFGTQPGVTQVATAISPAVTVEATDACGNPAAGEVAIAIGTNPANGTLTGTTSKALDADGVATFSDLKIDEAGTGYTLAAGSAGLSALSTSFNVVDYLCRSSLVCEASDAPGTTTVTTPGPPSGGAMGLSFDGFAPGFTCAGAPLFTSVGSLATIEPFSYVKPIQVTTRWAKSVAPGTGVANFVLCWSETGIGYAVAGACTKKGALPTGIKLCELSRSRNGVGDLVLTFLIAPADPYAGLGR